MKLRSVLASVGLVLTVAVAGCTAPPESAQAPPTGVERGPVPAVAALGDSISVGFAACGSAAPCEATSWSTGEAPLVDSLRTRLAAAWDVDEIEAVNLAEPGATVSDVVGQARQVPEGMRGVVTVLVGANDVCGASGGPPGAQEFATAVDDVLATVRDRAPEAVVVLGSVPDLGAVFTVVTDASPAVGSRVRCAGLSGSNGDAPGEVATAVQSVRQLIDAYNEALRLVCDADEACVWDSGAVHDWQPVLEDLSEVDRFHPSAAGQARLAELMWDAAVADPRAADVLLP